MKYSNSTGIGESRCQTPKDLLIRLNNIEIEFVRMELIFKKIQSVCPDVPDYWIRNMKKDSVNLWGHIVYGKKQITINRPSILTVLHEYAHAVAYHHYKKKDDHHGLTFCRTLDWLISSFYKTT